MKMSKRPNFVYLTGMIPVIFVVGLLVFLTLDNLLSSRAVYRDKLGGAYEVEGLAVILVNLGISSIIIWDTHVLTACLEAEWRLLFAWLLSVYACP